MSRSKKSCVGLDRFAEFHGLDAVRARIDFNACVAQHGVDGAPKKLVVVGPDEFEFTRCEHRRSFAVRS
jgi:hypothetical protein